MVAEEAASLAAEKRKNQQKVMAIAAGIGGIGLGAYSISKAFIDDSKHSSK